MVSTCIFGAIGVVYLSYKAWEAVIVNAVLKAEIITCQDNKMTEANELLRSAYQIAQREGKDTNWPAFIQNVERELMLQSGGHPDNEQEVLRSTVTPKTYRIIGG